MESDMPIELLVSREWCGTKWHYPNIERMVEENKRLRAELSKKVEELDAAWMVKDVLLSELAKVRQQRDEARRELCRLIGYQRQDRFDPKAIAVERGWDCFGEKQGGGA